MSQHQRETQRSALPTDPHSAQLSAERDLARFTRVSRQAAGTVIANYSTSFSLAARLLPRECRADIAAVYAFVRVADEVVDGVASAAGLDLDAQRAEIEALRARVHEAIASGFSSDVVVHAFAVTARRCGIGAELVDPFLDSMAMDLTPGALDLPAQQRYVYGSAEVIGLMCLRAFLAADAPAGAAVTANAATAVAVAANTTAAPPAIAPLDPTTAAAARALGAAFQNVNFLRDLAADAARGRHYLPEPDGTPGRLEHDLAVLSEETKRHWVRQVDADVATARTGLPALPRRCRPAVRAALRLFEELNRAVERTPAAVLAQTRIRVPGPAKARLLAVAVLEEVPWRRSS